MGMNDNPKLNGSGCKDPTAAAAVSHISREEKKVNDAIHIIKKMLDLLGLELAERMVIVDKKSGRVYR